MRDPVDMRRLKKENNFLSNMVLLRFKEQINIRFERLYKVINDKFIGVKCVGQTKFLPRGKYINHFLIISCLLRFMNHFFVYLLGNKRCGYVLRNNQSNFFNFKVLEWKWIIVNHLASLLKNPIGDIMFKIDQLFT